MENAPQSGADSLLVLAVVFVFAVGVGGLTRSVWWALVAFSVAALVVRFVERI